MDRPVMIHLMVHGSTRPAGNNNDNNNNNNNDMNNQFILNWLVAT